MQAPPSCVLPEKTVAHDGGAFSTAVGNPRFAQSNCETALRQAAAACASNWAVPFNTALTAADGMLKLSSANSGPKTPSQKVAFEY